jgi:hypothetical protein
MIAELPKDNTQPSPTPGDWEYGERSRMAFILCSSLNAFLTAKAQRRKERKVIQ